MFCRPNLLCTICAALLYAANAGAQTSVSIETIQYNSIWSVSNGNLLITAKSNDDTPLHGTAATVLVIDSAVKFEPGAVIIVTEQTNPVKITNSHITLAWSGNTMPDFVPEHWLTKIEDQEWLDGLSEEEFEELVKELEKQYKQEYFYANFGGFIGEEDEMLDIIADNSTLVFNVTIDTDTPESAWGFGYNNIHVGKDGAVLDIKNEMTTVIMRQIDDIVDGKSTGGNLTLTGKGTLVVGQGRNEHKEQSAGLNLGGTLSLEAGTLILTTDSTSTTHQTGNVVVEEGATLNISAGAMLEFTGENPYDIAVQKDATLLIACAENTGIVKQGTATNLLLNEGTVWIYTASENATDNLILDTLDTTLGTDGGTFIVNKGISFESGALTGEGDYTKTGEGTHVVNSLSLDGNLIITAGTTVLNNKDAIQQAGKVFIGSTETPGPTTAMSVLDITTGTQLELTGMEGYAVEVYELGILKISAADAGISGTGETTNLFLNGGRLEIYNDSMEKTEQWNAAHINTAVGTKGGTIHVAENVTFAGGTVSALQDEEGNYVKADVTKTGAGTHIVGDVNLGSEGTYHVQGGMVNFTGDVNVGTLSNAHGTVINIDIEAGEALHFDRFAIDGDYYGGGRDLTVGTEGSVTGSMTEVGNLTVSTAFNLGNGEHRIKTLNIEQGTFNLNRGATLHLTNDSDEADITVAGQLWIASAPNTGLVKQDGEESVNILLDGGTLRAYRPATGAALEQMTLNTDITLASGGVTFIVENNIDLETGRVTGEGNYQKLGGGTHSINGLEIEGELYIGDGKTFLNAQEEVHRAAHVKIQNGTFGVASGAVFETNTMVVQSNGGIANAGKINTSSLTLLGGTLELDVMPRLGSEETSAMLVTDTLILNGNAKITIVNDEYKPGEYEFGSIIEVTGGLTDAHVAALNTYQTATYRSQWTKTDNALDLKVQILSVQDYTKEIGWQKKNAVAAASLFDAHFYPEVKDLPPQAVEDIREQLKNLHGLSAPQLDTALRAAMAGELVGDAARLVMSSPQRRVFRQLDALNTHENPFLSDPFLSDSLGTMRGQARGSRNVRLWFTPYAQSEEGKADSNTFDGYSLTRAGFVVGGDMYITQGIVAGFFFQYGHPRVKNELGRISADDFLFGAYMQMPIIEQITLNAMIAGGFQEYAYKGAGGRAAFGGSAIFGSLELESSYILAKRKIPLEMLVALDFQSLGMDNLSVKLMPESVAPILMPIRPGGLDSAALRVRLLRYKLLGIEGRVQYIRQLSGNDCMASTMTLNGKPSSIRGVQWGKDWINVGLGYDFVQMKNLRFSVDYDFDASKRTVSHLGSVSAAVVW